MKVQRQSNLAAAQKVLAAAKRVEVRVGFFNTATYADGTPVAYVAAIQEFGYPQGGIPSRSFMRTTAAEKKPEWSSLMQRALAGALNAGTVDALQNNLTQVGGLAAGDISRTISKITSPPLKDSTLRARQSRKKSPGVSRKPLVDTGKMIQSVDSAVVMK